MGWTKSKDRFCWFFCFRDSGLVERKSAADVETVTVAEVQPGDYVRTSTGFHRVVYIHPGGHSDSVVDVEFETADGRRGSVGLTPQHLIYTTGDEVKKAEDLQVGDALQVQGGPAMVVALTSGAGPVRSLITETGDVLVNGVRVSSYAFDERLHHLTQSVAWLGRVDGRLPARVCQAGSPLVMRWVLPLLSEDVHEAKKAAKAAYKEAKRSQPPSKGAVHLVTTLQRVSSALNVSA